jgi:hypothetical protein
MTRLGLAFNNCLHVSCSLPLSVSVHDDPSFLVDETALGERAIERVKRVLQQFKLAFVLDKVGDVPLNRNCNARPKRP